MFLYFFLEFYTLLSYANICIHLHIAFSIKPILVCRLDLVLGYSNFVWKSNSFLHIITHANEHRLKCPCYIKDWYLNPKDLKIQFQYYPIRQNVFVLCRPKLALKRCGTAEVFSILGPYFFFFFFMFVSRQLCQMWWFFLFI